MKSTITSLSTKLFFSSFVLFSIAMDAQIKHVEVDPFEKVIISPHIAVTFVEGPETTVTVYNSTEPLEKFNIEVVGTTLRLYLDGAKTYTENEKVRGDEYDYKKPLYKGTVINATVTYAQLQKLSLRGEEKFVCESPIKQSEFQLKLFGESRVYFNEVSLDRLITTIYGESYLELKEGKIDSQKITAYGETSVNTLDVETNNTKITAFGDGSYRIAVTDQLKITSFGEATIAYEGNPKIKSMAIGDTTIQKIN